MLAEAAPAKVNLFLHVVGQRADGYHLLDSLAVFPGAADRLTAEHGERLALTVAGLHGMALSAEPDNLVLRAARALASHAGVPARATLVLDKRLPVASGIGGGSADAAAALRVLDRLWGLQTPMPHLLALAAGLGADVPACLASRPVRMGGVGEVLLPAPRLPPYGLVLVNPGVPVSTPAVFKARTPAFTPYAALPAEWGDVGAMAAALHRQGNDLQAAATALCPPIATVLDWLTARPGCLLARMSGSGATCFGLFHPGPAAAAAADAVPDPWWAWGGSCTTEGFTDGSCNA